MVRDLTKGKPLRLLLGFCAPLLIGNLFQQFYNMVDSIIVGKFIGKDALAARRLNRLAEFSYHRVCARHVQRLLYPGCPVFW